MYKNRSILHKTYAVIGGFFGIMVILIIVCIIVGIYLYRLQQQKRTQELLSDDFTRFKTIIGKYIVTIRKKRRFSPDQVKWAIAAFQYNENLLGISRDGKTWFQDHDTFGELCLTLQNLLSYTMDSTSKYYKDANIWKIIKYSITAISERIPYPANLFKTPWGTNWYQFSITWPIFLVAATYGHLELFDESEPRFERTLSAYISAYFKEPDDPTGGLKSMGWSRYGPNVVGMSMAVVGGQLYARTFNPKSNSQLYVQTFLKAVPVQRGDGFYKDGSFLFHVSRNDGYTTSFYHEILSMAEFYEFYVPGIYNNIYNVLAKKFKITEHPTIPYHHTPWFTRTGSKESTVGRQHGAYGLDIRGYERGIAYKSRDFILCFNGQKDDIAAYESDRTNQEWAQIWMMMRKPVFADDAPNWNAKLVPYLDGVHSYGLKRIDWPSGTSTTQTYNCTIAECGLCYYQNEAAAMFNDYTINLGNTANFIIKELCLITTRGIHLFYTCVADQDNVAEQGNYTIACHLGKLRENNQNTPIGVGSTYAKCWDKNITTFIYLKERTDAHEVVRQRRVKNPDGSNMLTALYLQPRSERFKVGFSNMYSRKDNHINELVLEPNSEAINGLDFRCERDPKYKDYIFLHRYEDKSCMVSYQYQGALPTSIAIPKTMLDDKFISYKVVDAILNSEKKYILETDGKQFQMMLKNVVVKEKEKKPKTSVDDTSEMKVSKEGNAIDPDEDFDENDERDEYESDDDDDYEKETAY